MGNRLVLMRWYCRDAERMREKQLKKQQEQQEKTKQAAR